MTPDKSLLESEVLTWLARLPFVAPEDLEFLTGQPLSGVQTLLRAMGRRGWTDSIAPASPEIDSKRLYVLTKAARRWLADQAGRPATDGILPAPLDWGDVLHYVIRLEVAVSLNIFAANLVATARHDEEFKVQHFSAVPAWRPRAAFWPPNVQGYGCLSYSGLVAPFFVAVDRPLVPNMHRRLLVRHWYYFREHNSAWGRDDIPPILVICPSPGEEEEWAAAALVSADRRKVAPMRLLLTNTSSGLADDPAGPVWRTAERSFRATLTRRFPLRGRVALTPAAISTDGRPDAFALSRTLLEWATSEMAKIERG
jgi:hypothetical protein